MRSGGKHTPCSARDRLVYACRSEVPAVTLPFSLKLRRETVNPVVMPIVSISHAPNLGKHVHYLPTDTVISCPQKS